MLAYSVINMSVICNEYSPHIKTIYKRHDKNRHKCVQKVTKSMESVLLPKRIREKEIQTVDTI